MKLATSVGTVGFQTPLILGSGRITETPDFFLGARAFGCSGMVTRSLRETIPPERLRTPAPRYHVFDEGRSMLNCEWCNEEVWERWRDEWAHSIKCSGGRLIISLSGRDITSCQHLIKAFDDLGCVDAYEINVSCSHSCAIYGNLNVDTAHLEQVISTCRQAANAPIWAKLSYSPVIGEMASVAENAGANAIVCTNSIGPGLVLDIETTKPVLGIKGGSGGVSGAAIFPIALWCVYSVAQAVEIPVVGVGGVDSASKALQMLMAGASLVQLYTAPALRGPSVFAEVIRGIEDFLAEHPQYDGVASIVGASQHWVSEESCFESAIPTIDPRRCAGCGKCVEACAFNALILREGAAELKSENCVGCNACCGVCAAGAIRPAREVG